MIRSSFAVAMGVVGAALLTTALAAPAKAEEPRRAGDPLLLARDGHHSAAADLLRVDSAPDLHLLLQRPRAKSLAAHLAGDGGGLPLFRSRDPHGALLDPGGDAGGLHPHGAGQGSL